MRGFLTAAIPVPVSFEDRRGPASMKGVQIGRGGDGRGLRARWAPAPEPPAAARIAVPVASGVTAMALVLTAHLPRLSVALDHGRRRRQHAYPFLLPFPFLRTGVPELGEGLDWAEQSARDL